MGNCFRLQRAASWADGHEWEEEEVVAGKRRTAAAVEKLDRCVEEVKIRVTKRQLLEKHAGCRRHDKARQQQVEKVLAELMTSGVVCYHQPPREGAWRPSLHSIPEAAEES